ncbi:MAG TPA: STN domain-containing protein [Roseateles sp.]|nr:STN domain-containing protein [Roseateles sp.]
MTSFSGRVSIFMVSLLLALSPVCARAQTAGRFEFNLPAQPLSDSLRAVGRTARVNVAFDPLAVAGRQAPDLKGRHSAQEALERLLRGSGLRLRATEGGSFWVEAGPGP